MDNPLFIRAMVKRILKRKGVLKNKNKKRVHTAKGLTSSIYNHAPPGRKGKKRYRHKEPLVPILETWSLIEANRKEETNRKMASQREDVALSRVKIYSPEELLKIHKWH